MRGLKSTIEVLFKKVSKWQLFLLVWFFVSVAILMILIPLNFPRLTAINKDYHSTSGTITGYLPEKHNSVKYRYQVNGVQYEKFGANPFIGSSPAGVTVTVFFATNSPDKSMLRNPGAAMKNEGLTIILACIVIGGLISNALITWLRGSK